MGKHLIGILKRRSVLLAAPGMLWVFFIMQTLLASSVTAQTWSEIANPSTAAELAPYFLTPSYGFVNDGDRQWRTTDGGNTWSLLDSLWKYGASPRQLCFVDQGHGYAACIRTQSQIPSPPAGGIYETRDSGNTWRIITNGGHDFTSVYVSENHVFATAANTPSQIYYTSNDGISWDSLSKVPTVGSTFRGSSNITGNRDSLVVFSVYNNGNNYIIYSSDLGKTWLSRQLTPQSDYPDVLYCVPHTCTVTRITADRTDIRFDVQSLYVSSPPFSSWHESITSEEDSWDVAGDGCAMYLSYAAYQTDSLRAILRSTDQGMTWIHIPGPPAIESDDYRFPNISVTGHGRVLYIWANSYTNRPDVPVYSLYRWTDNTLPVVKPSINIHRTSPAGTSDSLSMRSCDTARVVIEYQSTGCAYAKYQWLHLTGLDSSEYRVDIREQSLCSGISGAATITLFPSKPGSYPLKLDMSFIDDEFNQIDTTFNLHLLDTLNPARLVLLAKPVFDFGNQTLCQAIMRADSFRVAAQGCNAVSVESIVFLSLGGVAGNFSFKNSKRFIPGDSTRTFPITYKPTILGTDSGWILIYSFDGVTRRTDTIPVRGAGVADTRSFVFLSDTLHTRMCDSATATVTLQNTTCGILEVDSVSLPLGITLPPDTDGHPQLPLVLPQGFPMSLMFRFAPSRLSDTSPKVIAHVRFMEHGQTIAFDTLISLSAIVTRGIPAYTLSSTSLEFDSVSSCGQSRTMPVSMSSVGCDTLICSGTVPVPPFTISKSFASSLPVGSSDSVKVTFAPATTGEFYDTLVLQTNAGSQRVAMHGTGIRGGKYIASSIASADLGTIYVCQLRDTVLWLKNPGCATLAVSSGSFSNASFSSDLTYPILIKAGDSAIVHVHVVPDTSGHPLAITGTFNLTSDADTGRVITIPLQVNIVYPAHLSISLSSAQTVGAGQSVTFSVSLAGQAPGVSALHFDLSNDDNLLSFISASIPGLTLAGTNTGGPLGMTRHFTLSPVPTPGIIGSLTFHSFLSKDSSTPLALSAVSFDNSAGVANDCIASVDDAGSSFQYHYSCGDGLIQALMQSGTFKVDRIVPNPAQAEIAVSLIRYSEVPISYELFDALGRNTLSGSVAGGSFSLSVNSIPPGAYYLRLSSGGFVESRRVSVKR